METWAKHARFKVRPSVGVVLMHHILHSDDADNDADRTVREMIDEMDASRGTISKALLESALYCCNMEEEKGRFWHPLDWSFQKFLNDLLPYDLHFDRYYNQIYEKKKTTKPTP